MSKDGYERQGLHEGRMIPAFKALAFLCLVVLFSPNAAANMRAESADDYVARIAKDVIQKMSATAAFNELRARICPDEAARQHADPAVVGVLDCDNYRPNETVQASHTFADQLSAVDAAQGIWTTKGLGSCGRSYYTWTVASRIGMSEFTDQSGQIDIERTLEIGENSILTETLSSYHPIDGHHEQIGTRWNYVFADRNHVQVRNLRTGLTFNLTRCEK